MLVRMPQDAAAIWFQLQLLTLFNLMAIVISLESVCLFVCPSVCPFVCLPASMFAWLLARSARLPHGSPRQCVIEFKSWPPDPSAAAVRKLASARWRRPELLLRDTDIGCKGAAEVERRGEIIAANNCSERVESIFITIISSPTNLAREQSLVIERRMSRL